MIITIPGTPTRQRRARSKNGQRPYDPQKKEKADFIRLVQGQVNPSEKIRKHIPVRMSFFFYFKRPESHYRTGKNSHILTPSAPQYPSKASTPDLDNLIKFVKDCLNGVAYHDDCQVVIYGFAIKLYSGTGKEESIILIEEHQPCGWV